MPIQVPVKKMLTVYHFGLVRAKEQSFSQGSEAECSLIVSSADLRGLSSLYDLIPNLLAPVNSSELEIRSTGRVQHSR